MMLATYSENKTNGAACAVNKAAIKNTNTCMRAEHNENGIINMVKSRNPRERMTLVPIKAGTLQPNPINSITKLRPSKPKRDMSASIRNAALER